MSYWETINNDLSGQNGFVYLMFVGRETIGKIIVEDITTSKFQILAVPKDQVYAAISFLEKKKHIRQIRKEGRSKIRTAILEPIVESFQHFNWEFNEDAIKVIGKYMSYFPEYSTYLLKTREANIRGKEWSYLIETLYYPFLRDLSGIAFSKIFNYISPDLDGNWLGKMAIRLVIKSWDRILKTHYKKASTQNLKEAIELQTKIVNQLTRNEQKILAKYSWQIADKPLADILGKTPEEWKEFQKFINSTILKTFKKENG